MNRNHYQALFFVLLAAFGAAGVAAYLRSPASPEDIEASFAPFSPEVKTRHDSDRFFVESNGLPDHEMMTGITAWQQQVPLPQNYTGGNSWSFPLVPKPAENPLSAKTGFFRGAIAIAVNGVPIFNPIKNDGVTDTLLAGELDEFGGHSGRGDDYHYHIAPTHLQAKVGPGKPLAYALDGYAIYGYTEADGSTPKGLDSFNGHSTPELGYHYHATKTYPYLNGGFHGEVVEREGQVDPQPRASSPRPATTPLRGAAITGFKTVEKNKAFQLTYTLRGETRHVHYTLTPGGGVRFDFIDGHGGKTTEVYRGEGVGGRGGRRGEPSQGGPGAPPAGDTPRTPWFVAHAKGLDKNGDGVVAWEEVDEQCKSAFNQTAQGADAIPVKEVGQRPTAKNEVGGFLKAHAEEIDQNKDGNITLIELTDTMRRMFDKQDKDKNGKLEGGEATP